MIGTADMCLTPDLSWLKDQQKQSPTVCTVPDTTRPNVQPGANTLLVYSRSQDSRDVGIIILRTMGRVTVDNGH